VRARKPAAPLGVEFWDRCFAAMTEPGSPRPGVLELGRRLAPSSRVLDVGSGNGANAIPLAELGHRVDALDYASEGLRRCAEFARERGVLDRVRVIHADMATHAYPRARYDLVIAVGSLQNLASHRSIAPVEVVLGRLKAATRRGGTNYVLVTADVRTSTLHRSVDARVMSADELGLAWQRTAHRAQRLGALDRATAARILMRQYADPAWAVDSLIVPERFQLFALSRDVLRRAYWLELVARRVR
jgi:SAM-dependent methyltransferase